MGLATDKKDEQRGRNARQGRNAVRQQRDSEFINRELTKDEVAEYREWRLDIENVFILWTELLEAGYRVNTKYDDYSSSCAAFIIPGDGSDNDGYILTGRGGNAYRAVSESIYKHVEIFRGAWMPASAVRQSSEDPNY